MDRDEASPKSSGIDPFASRAVVFGMLALLLGGVIAYISLDSPAGPPPPEVAGDPLLARGREIFLERCVSCHGELGRGDGPLARGLPGRPPRDLVGDAWRHGERPEQVLAVLEDGVKDAQMPAWGGTFGPDDLRSVAAYVYHLGGRAVPAALRVR